MVAAVGMGAFTAGMFHLVTHAFFKALLFLSAGSVIQGVEAGMNTSPARKNGKNAHVKSNHSGEEIDPQDMRNMGGLRTRMKLTYWVYLIGALALAGIFPLAGFFSKDEILAQALRLQPGVFALLITAAFLTALYMARQIAMVFFGEPRSEVAGKAHENPPVMTVPLVILAALSVLGGALNLPGLESLAGWLEHTLTGAVSGAFVLPLALAALAVSLIGLFAGWWLYGRNSLKRGEPDPLKLSLGGLFTALEHKWWVDELYDAILISPYKHFAAWMAGSVDLGFINAIGDGLASGAQMISSGLRKVQTGYVRTYALMMLLGAAAIFAFIALR
jgi:NADH-quinone oxidoreductase subunit L